MAHQPGARAAPGFMLSTGVVPLASLTTPGLSGLAEPATRGGEPGQADGGSKARERCSATGANPRRR